MEGCNNGYDARYQRGLKTMYELGGKGKTDEFLAGLSDVCPALGDHIVSSVYGDLHQRSELDPAERELITLTTLVTLGGCERELRLHAEVGLAAGLSPARIVEAMLHVAAYAGVPRALNAVMTVRETFAELNLLPVATEESRTSGPD